MLFVHQGTPEQGDEFFERLWPEARAVSDRERRLYRAFGIRNGSLSEVIGLRALASGVRAAVKGNGIGKTIGSPFTMPGLFLLVGGEVVWTHDYRHSGDHPDFRRIPEHAARESRTGPDGGIRPGSCDSGPVG